MRLPYPITPSRLTEFQSPFQAHQGDSADEIALRHHEQRSNQVHTRASATVSVSDGM
jgi:hypothetical protein